MPSPMIAGRLAVLLAAASLLILLLAACGSDPEPTATLATAPSPTATTAPATMPEPTATPVPPPTQAPEPTATPIPPTPTQAPEPTATPAPTPTQAPEPTDEPAPPPAMATLENFVITAATTGGDMLALISEQEAACIKGAVGDAFYQILQSTPFAMLAGGGDIAQAAPLFNCLAEENVIYLSVAFLDLQAGGWDDESRSCITDIALTHPHAVYVRLGLDLGGGPVDPELTMEYNIAIHECLSDQDKKDYTLGVWLGLDSGSEATGADIFALLSEDEAACAEDLLQAEQLAAMAVATPLQAITIGSPASGCISHETNVAIFVSSIDWGLGGITDDTRQCLNGFAQANPSYVELFTAGLEGIYAMPADEFVSLTEVGNDQYDCMTEEEVMRVQHTVTAALSAPQGQ